MNDLLSSIVVAAFSFLFGALINRWWNRAKPLIVLQGFSTSLKSKDVESTHELQQLSDDSWFSERFPPEMVPISEIESLYLFAIFWEPQLEDAAEKIALWRDILDQGEYVKDALQDLITHEGMRQALDLALRFQELHINNVEVDSNPPLIDIVRSDNENGSFLISWKRKASRLGEDLNTFPFLESRYEPFIRAIESLNGSILSEALKEIEPLVERQARILRHIAEITEPMLIGYKQWAARVLIENYGASPMVISQVTRLVVKSDEIKKQGIPTDCDLYIENNETGNLDQIKGPFVLGPGEKNYFWAVTTKTQNEIKEGDTLRIHYMKADAKANLTFKIDKKGALGAGEIVSNDEIFMENLDFPRDNASY